MLAFFAAVVLAATMGSTGEDAFYQPPAPLPAGSHGDLLRSQPLTNAAALPSASRNVLVLYLSQRLDGSPVAVSGTVAIPRGTPPAGGWPIVSWAHGTTGDAPRCTPSRDTGTERVHDYLKVVHAALDTLVAHGYAVVQTDYQGQGTPGPHPYLVGEAEGRDVVDIVRAARRLDPTLGSRFVVAGHSEGGMAALFAASLAPAWAPELKLLGVAAFAPASHLDLLVTFMHTYDRALEAAEFGSLLVAAYAQTYPDVKPESFLTPDAYAKLAETKTRCVFDDPGFWATTPPASTFRPGADIEPLVAAAAKNDPAALHIAVPALLLQGDADDTVMPQLTEAVRKKLCASGATIDLVSYSGQGHIGVVTPGMPDALAWFDARFSGKPAPSTCTSG
jgi:pimeloyl-ACP methyl ester carboxylesterase